MLDAEYIMTENHDRVSILYSITGDIYRIHLLYIGT